MSFMSSRGFIWILLLAACVYTVFVFTPYALPLKVITIVYTVYYFMWAQAESIRNDPAYMVKLALKLEESQKKFGKKCEKKLYKQETDANVNDE